MTADNTRPSIDELSNQLYDLLANSPEGRVRDALMADLGISEVGLFHQVKGDLQDKLGNDQITVVGDSATNNEGGWTYSLQGDPAHPISQKYLISKAENILGRQRRNFAVTKALKNGTRGNTLAGRAIRRLLESQRRCMMDTVEVLVELGVRPTEDGDDDA